MTDKILKYMEEYNMLPENGNMVAGVSGGADSVCLLYALVQLRDRQMHGLNLSAVHVNHKLRSQAGKDAAFVEELCRRWKVPFVLVEEDVEELAQRLHLSCEEAGRMVRYRAFERALARMDGGSAAEAAQRRGGGRAAGTPSESENGAGAVPGGCIAVAHNRDDRAETLLFHLFRGTGLAGMGSIRPVRENADGSKIIRPLLFAGRQEIEVYLQREGLTWRTDHTNAQEIYTRNKIRNRILPYAENEICRQAKAHLAREAELLAETADFVEEQTQEALRRCTSALEEDRELAFEVDAFLREGAFLQDQMLRRVMGQVGCQRDLTAAHVAEVKKLFAPSCTSGRRVDLPVLRIGARRQFGRVIFRRLPEAGRSDRTGAERENCSAAAVRNAGKRTETARPEAAAYDSVPVVPGIFYVPGLGSVRARLLPGPAQPAASDGLLGEKARREAPQSDAFPAFLKNIPEKKYTKWFDYDKIIKSVMFRTRRAGDYLTINDALNQKSLRRYMIEEKIPAEERDMQMLLADGQHVMWVVGHRISAAYKVTAATATVLELCCDPAEPDCGMEESHRML